jgi:hypothetical protein
MEVPPRLRRKPGLWRFRRLGLDVGAEWEAGGACGELCSGGLCESADHVPQSSSALHIIGVSIPNLQRLRTGVYLPVLKVCHVGLASLVGQGVVLAPLGCDPAEVAARVFPLSVVAHVVECRVVDAVIA